MITNFADDKVRPRCAERALLGLEGGGWGGGKHVGASRKSSPNSTKTTVTQKQSENNVRGSRMTPCESLTPVLHQPPIGPAPRDSRLLIAINSY